MKMFFNTYLLNYLACPKTGDKLYFDKEEKKLTTLDKQNVYEIVEGIPILSI
tara:strand:+ start:836 stop:991 length:156 start_codon:yes stop_codon:yes gene_type:complete